MSGSDTDHDDAAPGEGGSGVDVGTDTRSYAVGLGLAVLLTVASFGLARTSFIYAPALPIALVVLAIAQIGIHLVFFLHITTSPDNTNNVIALAFGVFIVVLIIGGSIWIMDNLNANMPSMDKLMQMQR